MVRRTHKYADGGKVVKDHTATGYVFPKPTYGEAVADRIKEMVTPKKRTAVTGTRRSQLDKTIEDAGG